MGTFAEAPSQTRGQRNALLSEAVPQSIHRAERLFPPLFDLRVQQVQLALGGFKRGRVHAQQADGFAIPVSVEQAARGFDDLGIHRRGVLQGSRPRNRLEVLEPQLQLYGPRLESVLAEPPADHLAQTRQGRVQDGAV